MKRVLVGMMVALIALAVSASPALADKRTQREAQRLLDKAGRQASHKAVCKIKLRPPTVTHDAPSPALLNTLGILRRPATPDDALPQTALGLLFFAQDIYIDYVRVAHAADGTSYFVFAARNVGAPLQTDACLHEIHVDLLALVKGRSKRVRHRALRLFAKRVRQTHSYAKRVPREAVLLFERRADGSMGGGGGGGDAPLIEAGGSFITSGTPGQTAHAFGLIPDGVASVESFFPQTAKRGSSTKTYAAPIDRTDPVQDNVVSFSVPRDAEDAFPSRMIWRAADGSVVREVRQPG